MKRLYWALLILLSTGIGEAKAYDVSVLSGNTLLYYNIDTTNHTAVATFPGDSNNYWIPGQHHQPADTLIIPSTITHEGVTYVVRAIDHHAFANCYDLRLVMIGDSVSEIGDYAFRYCNQIRGVVFPSRLIRVGAYAFESCIDLKRVQLPEGLTELGEGCFTTCRMLDSVFLPQSLTMIPSYAFSCCNSLNRIVLPNALTTIGQFAFNDCAALHHLRLPHSIVHIGGSAFFNCRQLQSIELPRQLDTIKAYTFRDCSQLRHVRIPASVTKIEGNSFANDYNLSDIITLNPIPPIVDANAFLNVPRSATVHIPCGSTADYSTASVWSEFGNLMEYHGYNFECYADDSSMGTVEVIVEPTCTDSTAIVQAIPFEYYRFNRWQDGDTANPRTIDVTVDSLLVAYFIYVGPTAINESAAELPLVSVSAGSIVVTRTHGLPIRIFSTDGRLIHATSHSAESQCFAIRLPGVYLVQIGELPARKVVVLP